MKQLDPKNYASLKFAGASTAICLFLILFFPFYGLANDTNTLESEQSPNVVFTNIFAARAELDKELQKGLQEKDVQKRAEIKNKIVKQARLLADKSGKFLERFPTNANFLHVSQQQIYGEVMSRILHKENAAYLGNMVEYIPSCLFEIRISQFLHVSMMRAVELQSAGESAFADAAIDAMRFGAESYNGIYPFMRRARTDAGKRVARVVLANPATDDSLKLCAQAVLNRKYSTGQTLPFEFTALDGRQVNLSKMRGKVLLVDFWATGCTPCMEELPELKSLYEKYHDQGFEIIGISSDGERTPVLKVVQEKKLPWPIYCDENGHTNQFAVACGVTGIPDYWLVDRKGVVREMDARDNLADKVKFLTAEAP